MKKLLFPTDFSEASAAAFQYAMNLARSLNADLDLLNVFHLEAAEVQGMQPMHVQKLIAERKEEIGEKMEAFEKEYTGHLNDTEFKKQLNHIIIYGVNVSKEIIDLADANKYDMIILGMQGEHNVIEKILGSISTQVLKEATKPVLAVPRHATFTPPKQILYATELRPEDENAVSQLGQIAGELGALIHFVHVHRVKDREPEVILEDEVNVLSLPVTDFTVIHGDTVMEGLEAYTKDHEVDLLAVFRPQRKWWQALFHNSLIKRLAYHTEIPLLVFHE